MFLLYFVTYYVRDEGVAGSTPVAPTIDFTRFFHRSPPTCGSAQNVACFQYAY
jgi:hypothetical protein